MPTKYVHPHAKTLYTCSVRHTSWCTNNVHLILMLVMRTYAYEICASACKNTAHLFCTAHLLMYEKCAPYPHACNAHLCLRNMSISMHNTVHLFCTAHLLMYEKCAPYPHACNAHLCLRNMCIRMQKHCTPVLYGTPLDVRKMCTLSSCL